MSCRTTKAQACDGCGLPEHAHDGVRLMWPHLSPEPARATREERAFGVPFWYPPETAEEGRRGPEPRHA